LLVGLRSVLLDFALEGADVDRPVGADAARQLPQGLERVLAGTSRSSTSRTMASVPALGLGDVVDADVPHAVPHHCLHRSLLLLVIDRPVPVHAAPRRITAADAFQTSSAAGELPMRWR